MNIFLLISIVILWIVVLFLGFLLLGSLRALGLLSWRMEQLEATTPKRLGRDGLKPGKKARYEFSFGGKPPDGKALAAAQKALGGITAPEVTG